MQKTISEDYFEYVDNFKKNDNISSVEIFNNSSETSPEVTIGIPTYKRINTLKHALDSALSQVYSGSYEILVLDNNPERYDETEEFMTKNYGKISRVKYYKNATNLGMAGNWNRIFYLARTRWVSLLHDDDIIAPSFIEDMLNVAKKYNANIVNSEFVRWREDKTARPIFDFKKEKYPVIKSTLSSNHFYHMAGMPSGILYERSVYIKEGGVNSDYFPSLDYVFNSKLSYKYNFLVYLKPLTIYRLSINESSNKKTIRTYICQDYFFRQYIGSLVKHPSFYTKYVSMLYCRHRLNQLQEKSISIPEISNHKLRCLNFVEKILLGLCLKLNIAYYRMVNRVGFC